jgi:hypothetical protein
MKFCPVVPEICRGQVHVPKKERKKKNNNNNNKKWQTTNLPANFQFSPATSKSIDIPVNTKVE